MKYVSDVEQGEKERVSEEITKDIHNGIVGIYKRYVRKKSFFESAGVACPCAQSFYAFDEKSFLDLVRGEIPDFKLEYPDEEDIFSSSDDNTLEYDKYKILDFIQFCHTHLKKATLLNDSICHDNFSEDSPLFQHYIFENCDNEKENFRKDINTLFRRNGIIFELKETGEIVRTIPSGLVPLVSKLYTTKDEELNKLVEEAFDRFVQSRLEDRTVALEKIWDGFERMKTYYKSKNKKESIKELIKEVSNQDETYSTLLEAEAEADALTKIGNNFRIRHHETNKHEIIDNNQIDYFFYRMVSFMALFLKNLENK